MSAVKEKAELDRKQVELLAKQSHERLSQRVSKLEDKFYMIYWHGDCPKDYHSLCAVISAISEELDEITAEVNQLLNLLNMKG